MVFEVAPTAPDGLTATPSAATVTLAWVDHATLPAATMYTVERATDAAFTANVTTIPINSATATGYVDTPLPSGTYYYRVRAEDAPAYSPWWPTTLPLMPPVAATVP